MGTHNKKVKVIVKVKTYCGLEGSKLKKVAKDWILPSSKLGGGGE